MKRESLKSPVFRLFLKVLLIFPHVCQHVVPGEPGGQPGAEHLGQARVALSGGGGRPGGQGLLPGQGGSSVLKLYHILQDIDRCCPASNLTGWDEYVRRLLKTPGKIVKNYRRKNT